MSINNSSENNILLNEINIKLYVGNYSDAIQKIQSAYEGHI